MIRETIVDKALNRLSRHFSHGVLVYPPASASLLAELEAQAGPLPRELTIFLATCDGLRLKCEDVSPRDHLWSIPEMLSVLREGTQPVAMVPVRGESDGALDWVVTESGPAHNSVVRWDPMTRGAELIASSFGQYFDAWVTYMIECYDPAKPAAGRPHMAFDEWYTARFDHEAAALRNQPDMRQWVKELDYAVASGDDFE